MRLHLLAPLSRPLEQGSYLVSLRAPNQKGWLLGLAGTRPRIDGPPDGLEVVVLARPDLRCTALMYLPEETLETLAPIGQKVQLRALRPLLPVQHDCPEQWLRDRLLKLADMVEVAFSEGHSAPQPEVIREALQSAGLHVVGKTSAKTELPILPADAGNRVSEEELGYWNEEMRLNTRCAASMEGESRLDAYMAHMPG